LATVSAEVGLRPLLVGAKDAARLLGIGRTTLYELMKLGAIVPVRIGRCVRFPVADLERFVESGCTVESDTGTQPKPPKREARRRPPRRGAPREVTPRLFDPAS
jgi:excisionase family DNA binding protein